MPYIKGKPSYFIAITSFALLALAMKVESYVCRENLMQHCHIGAGGVMELLSGVNLSNALIVGHYDESGRHQPWGIIYCAHRHTQAWSAAGHAYGAASDGITKHHGALNDFFGYEWPFSRS